MQKYNVSLTEKNKEFIQKLNKIYDRKSSSSCMSRYHPPNQHNNITQKNHQNHQNIKNKHKYNPLQKVHQINQKQWKQFTNQIQTVIIKFVDQVKLLIRSLNDDAKFYHLIKYMKQNVLLWDLAQTINKEIIEENVKIKKQIAEIKKSYVMITKQQLSPEINKTTKSQPTNIKNKINPFKSIAENIYFRSKTMQQSEFIQWCDSILMKDKLVVLENHHKKQKYQNNIHNKSISKDKNNQNHQFKLKVRLPQNYTDYEIPNQRDLSRKDILQKIKTLEFTQNFINNKNEILTNLIRYFTSQQKCQNICCKYAREDYSAYPKTSLRDSLHKKSQKSPQNKSYYWQKKQNEYFNRYYKASNFDLTNVTHVQKTKSDQLEKLQKKYFKMLELRAKHKEQAGSMENTRE